MSSAIPALATLLANLQVTGGGLTAFRFDCAPWGRHYDRNNWPSTAQGIITIRALGDPRRPADIGGGAADGHEELEVQVGWEDQDGLADPDAFRSAVKEALKTRVRGSEKTLGDAWYTDVANILDADRLIGSQLAFGIVATVRARMTEVYAP